MTSACCSDRVFTSVRGGSPGLPQALPGLETQSLSGTQPWVYGLLMTILNFPKDRYKRYGYHVSCTFFLFPCPFKALVANRHLHLFWGPPSPTSAGRALSHRVDRAFLVFLRDDQQTGWVRTVVWDWAFEGAPAVSVQALSCVVCWFSGWCRDFEVRCTQAKAVPWAPVFLSPL